MISYAGAEWIPWSSRAAKPTCAFATVLGAIDWGFRTVLATDAICSSSDASHDALLNYYEHRFSEQLELACTEVIIQNWR